MSGAEWQLLTLQADAMTRRVVAALAAASVEHLLLKGPASAALLGATATRVYTDVDVLVGPLGRPRTAAVLRDLGLTPKAAFPLDEGHAQVWKGEAVPVDLHTRLHGVTIDDDECWDLLWAGRRPFQVMGVDTWVLGEADHAFLFAAHAANPGKALDRVVHDLTRALEVLPRHTWETAASRARLLGGEAAFAAGLSRTDAGRQLVPELGITAKLSAMARVRFDRDLPRPTRSLLRAAELGRTAGLRYLWSKAAPADDVLLLRDPVPPGRWRRQRALLKRWARAGREAPSALRHAISLRADERRDTAEDVRDQG